jgi:hypothetical protein
MTFKVLPIIDLMLQLYSEPPSPARFQKYLALLQGDSRGDLVLPIGGYNPMAKGHIQQKLFELKELGAEQIMSDTLQNVNPDPKEEYSLQMYDLVLNLADDLKGGWTNRYTTDYDSKFRLNALVTRKFCTPYFWSSENYTAELIRVRTLQYVYRTIYWKLNSKPVTLREHVEQEIFVERNVKTRDNDLIESAFEQWNQFYQQYEQSDNYHQIFAFFYGDRAASVLGFPVLGLQEEMEGFKYARMVSRIINK